MSKLRALLQYLIQPLVDDPDRVKLDWVETPQVSLFYLTAARGDLGRLLGKKGQTIEDIRSVMEAVAAQMGREVIIDVVEQKKRSNRRRSRGARAAKPSSAKAENAKVPSGSAKRRRPRKPASR
jgi:hypothetical protein